MSEAFVANKRFHQIAVFSAIYQLVCFFGRFIFRFHIIHICNTKSLL